MQKRLDNKTAIITGSARGIGKTIAERFFIEGANIVLVDLNEEELVKTYEEFINKCKLLDLNKKKVNFIKTNVSIEKQVTKMIDFTVSKFNNLHILVNNAGIAINKLIEDQTLEEWNEILNINLTGYFLCSKYAAKEMKNNKVSKIINISSVSGQKGAIGRSAYGVSKAGIIQLTRELAVEYADYNILVNSIAPGPILTEITNNSNSATESYIDRIPLKRFGSKESIASAAVYFGSDECDFTTGHTLNVDGGFFDAGLIFPKKDIKI